MLLTWQPDRSAADAHRQRNVSACASARATGKKHPCCERAFQAFRARGKMRPAQSSRTQRACVHRRAGLRQQLGVEQRARGGVDGHNQNNAAVLLRAC
jgi:hypothetical protein